MVVVLQAMWFSWQVTFLLLQTSMASSEVLLSLQSFTPLQTYENKVSEQKNGF